jgi:hypothetical protein
LSRSEGRTGRKRNEHIDMQGSPVFSSSSSERKKMKMKQIRHHTTEKKRGKKWRRRRRRRRSKEGQEDFSLPLSIFFVYAEKTFDQQDDSHRQTFHAPTVDPLTLMDDFSIRAFR